MDAAQHLALAPPAGNHPQGQNVPAAQQVYQAQPVSIPAGQNVPAAQQLVPALAAGNPAADAAQHLALAPPARHHPQGQNIPAAEQLPLTQPAGNPAQGQNVPAAQQVVPELLSGNPAADQNIRVQLGNDPEHPQMIRDSSSPNDGPAVGQN